MRPIERYSGNWGRRRRFGWLKKAAVGLVVLVIVAAGVAVFQVARATPSPTVVSAAPARVTVPGAVAPMPWPGTGEATVGIERVGTIGSSGGDAPLAIASIAKVMTAYVVLHDHPLTLGASGPSITMTPADVANYQAGLAGKQSVVKVQAGEALSELQALEGLLIPSGNNLAISLANWDAGSVPAFVAKMNAAAAQLGMRNTHYNDAVGLDPGTLSDASVLIILAQKAMADPVFAFIVGEAQVDLPVVGLTFNTNSLIGHNGVIGIKTGTSDQAGGCFLFAAQRTVAGKPETVIGAVLNQRGNSELETVLAVSQSLMNAAPAAASLVTILPKGTVVGTVHVPWGRSVQLVTAQPVTVLGWPGLTATTRLSLKKVQRNSPAGTAAGSLVVTLAGADVTVPVVTAAPIGSPSASWKLKRL